MTERDYFLQSNPDIYRFLQNDTSLKKIATSKELRNINPEYLREPQLYFNSDIDYNLNSFDVPNYMKILLCMIVNNKLSYTIHYTNCCCYAENVQGLLEVAQKAFEICHSRFIEYFSGILGITLESEMRMHGNLVEEVDVHIAFEEHYPGALSDTHRFIRLCDYVKNELIRYNKINNRMSEYEIAKVLFNWVVLHTNYDLTFRKTSYSGYSALCYGTSVCQGFTALYNALCKCFGLRIVGMSGEGLNKYSRKYEKHIWSFACLNNRNTYMDVTWGSPHFQNEDVLKRYNIDSKLFCDFSFFDIPYRELMKEHRWDTRLYG